MSLSAITWLICICILLAAKWLRPSKILIVLLVLKSFGNISDGLLELFVRILVEGGMVWCLMTFSLVRFFSL